MDEIKKALHKAIDEIEIPTLEVDRIRVTVILKRPKAKQGAENTEE